METGGRCTCAGLWSTFARGVLLKFSNALVTSKQSGRPCAGTGYQGPLLVTGGNRVRPLEAACRSAKQGTVIPRLTKIIRSGITFVSRNLR